MKTKLLSLLLSLLLLIPLLSLGQWTQVGTDIDGESVDDNSGISVSLSADGDIMAVGAPYNDGNGTDSGQVRMYENISGVWTQIGNDIDGEAAGDQSGYSLSLSSDGSIVAVGAPYNSGVDSGHVRVYENISGVWTQIGSDIDGGAGFGITYSGWSVSLSSDGSIVAIGGIYGDTGEAAPGRVRVFENIAGVWVQVGDDIYGEAALDLSGSSVSLSSDGSVVAIGANENDGNGTDSGHVRVHENIAGVWTQVGADIDGEAAGDWFGWTVSLNSDGSIVAIGAHYNDGNGTDSGHVRVYKNISGIWTQIGSDIDGEASFDSSGYSVSLNSSGNIVAIGAPYNSGNGSVSGHVRVYENTSGIWTQINTDIDGESSFDDLGESVSLSSDGSIVAIGAPYNSGNGSGSGHVRVYKEPTLSVQENTFGSSFLIYPNPSFGLSKIQLGESYNEVSVNVFNVLGKQVASQKYNNIDEVELNTEEYATGIYFIKVQSGTKGATIKLVVK